MTRPDFLKTEVVKDYIHPFDVLVVVPRIDTGNTQLKSRKGIRLHTVIDTGFCLFIMNH